jgi:HPt (histidine-containing phosphotransfer) domain-containing protein
MSNPAVAPAELQRPSRVTGGVAEQLVFLEDADDRMRSLHQIMRRRDAAAIARSADVLRGASAHLGAAHLARLCGTLGADAAAGNLAGADALVDAIESEIGRVRSSLKPPRQFGVPPKLAIRPERSV